MEYPLGMPIETKKIFFGNGMEVKAGTTGYCGCRVSRAYIKLSDLGGSCIDYAISDDGKALEILAAGDDEIETLIEAMQFIADVLQQQAI